MTTRRPRHRYIRFRVTSDRRCQEGEVADAIRRGVLYLYGVHGLSQIEPVLIEFNELGQTGILRSNHIHLRRMRASLAYTTEICGSAAALRVLRISGTLKSLRAG